MLEHTITLSLLCETAAERHVGLEKSLKSSGVYHQSQFPSAAVIEAMKQEEMISRIIPRPALEAARRHMEMIESLERRRRQLLNTWSTRKGR